MVPGKTTLHYSPRWKRKCWLNGSNVIRTTEPHGLSASEPDGESAGTFVSWKKAGTWKFAKVVDADKRNLRLEFGGALPVEHTPLYEVRPLDGPNLPAEIEEVGLLDEELPAGAIEDVTAEDLQAEESPEMPLVISTGPTASLDPLSSIPGLFGKLSEVGSFIVPTPMLPMDLVKAAVKMLLKMGVMIIPSTGKPVFEFTPPDELADSIYQLVVDSESVAWEEEDEEIVKGAIEVALASNQPVDPQPVFFKKISEAVLEKGPFLVIAANPPVKAVVDSIVPRYVIEGEASKAKSGAWVVGEFSDGLRALQIADIAEYIDDDEAERFSLRFENLTGNVGELQNVYADFRGELVAEGAAINISLVDPDDIELEQVPETLTVGQDVLLSAEGEEPVAAKIDTIKGNSITTSPRASGYTKGDLVILGNVVIASHGESKPEKILGSGGASRSNQEFTLEVDQVSFTPDPSKSSGVAAAIDVIVAGRVWEQVSTLKDSTFADHHYAIRMTEDGHVRILFGDGDYGRRLPTGTNNIRVRYRVGSGLAGNVPANALAKPVKPHPRIDTVMQPLPAAGGGDMEDAISLRENAPPTLLALERAVSLSDFSHLAAAQSSVWQARAYSQISHGGRAERVAVVIVPAGGIQSAQIRKTIRSFLQKHALPGVQVSVDPFVEERVSLSLTVRVKTDEFVADEVQKAVATALVDHFTLQNRKLGEHLYLSEVYKVVEGVRGVENSICVLNEDESLQIVTATNESTVVYLDTEAETNPSRLEVAFEEYLP